MNFIKTERAYYEQLTYPDRSTRESWLIGLREHRAIYVHQMNITQEGINTYWGVIRKRLLFKLPVESLSLTHRTPPSKILSPFWVSVKPGLAHSTFCSSSDQ